MSHSILSRLAGPFALSAGAMIVVAQLVMLPFDPKDHVATTTAPAFQFGGAAIATSPAAMAYVTTETGVVTMLLVILLAGFLLVRRAADFDNLRPTGMPTVLARARQERLA